MYEKIITIYIIWWDMGYMLIASCKQFVAATIWSSSKNISANRSQILCCIVQVLCVLVGRLNEELTEDAAISVIACSTLATVNDWGACNESANEKATSSY